VNAASKPQSEIVVATLYKFVDLCDPAALAVELNDFCATQEITGTIILATEGINATLAGSAATIASLLAQLRSQPYLSDLRANFSIAPEMPFRRLKVKQRAEIVSIGIDVVAPQADAGTYVSAAAWNALLHNPEIVLLDTRNEYESRIGSFAGAIAAGTQNFREFPQFVKHELQAQRDQPIAMFCTGGIRCEKASAYLLEQGYETVYQLEGGILQYLEATAPENSLWRGDCFVFDSRVALDHQLQRADFEQCYGCRRPLSAADRASPLYEPGISCAGCHARLQAPQRRGFAERRHQVKLAELRGDVHIGALMSEDEVS
jgi:UPF0176 protein